MLKIKNWFCWLCKWMIIFHCKLVMKNLLISHGSWKTKLWDEFKFPCCLSASKIDSVTTYPLQNAEDFQMSLK